MLLGPDDHQHVDPSEASFKSCGRQFGVSEKMYYRVCQVSSRPAVPSIEAVELEAMSILKINAILFELACLAKPSG